MEIEFHATSAAQCPKYNGKAKYEATSIAKQFDKNNYTKVTIGLDSNNRKMQETHSVFENGNLVKEGTDFDNDGKPDYFDSWEYDEKGNMTAWYQDFNNDGNIDRVSRYLYDANNNLIQFGSDNDMDGKADNMTYLEYDKNGNLTKYSVDEDYDGIADKSNTMEYDENNNCVQKLVDKDNNGIYDEVYKYLYENGETRTATDATFYSKDGLTFGYVDIYDCEGNIVSRTMK